jgi:hypothetical protein
VETTLDAQYLPLYLRTPVTRDIGKVIRAVTADLVETGEQVPPPYLLYAEKKQGFSCRTCEHARPQNATHGACQILTGTIHLDEGCCVAWTADKRQLQLYREPGT